MLINWQNTPLATKDKIASQGAFWITFPKAPCILCLSVTPETPQTLSRPQTDNDMPFFFKFISPSDILVDYQKRFQYVTKSVWY